MNKTIAMIVFLSLGVACNSYADDCDRIDQLEKQVQELKLRVSKLEALLNKTNAAVSKPKPGAKVSKPVPKLSKPGASKDIVTSGDGWKSISNWKKLLSGMSHEDVQKILGAPSRTRGGDYLETWNYPNSGYVMFKYGKVLRWTDPSQ